MKLIHAFLRRCFLPAAAGSLALLLGACANSGPSSGTFGEASTPAPVVPEAGVSRGLRHGTAAITPDSIDGLLKGGSGSVDSPFANRTAPAPPPLAPRGRQSFESRPGLGTAAGYTMYNRVENTSFYRRSEVPDAVASFHYNDEQGAKAMADLLGGGTRRTGLFSTAGGRLKVGLVSYGTEVFPRLEAKGRQIVMGQPGGHYEIRVENTSQRRVEVVTSVDSVNVMTGKKAGTSQRGYVIDPKGTLNISGFRINDSKVNRFVFSSVAASKAAGEGLARNVGVVGLAVFDEDEAKARMKLRQEQFQREDADAFPVTQR